MKKLFTLIAAFFITYASFALVPIAGTLGACAGSGSSLSDSTAGGTWSSSNVFIAAVGSTGYVSAISPGTTTITYSLGGSSYVTATYLVSPAPAHITGATSWCVGSTAIVTDATAGGTWSSSSTGVATIDATTGVVTGISPGTTNIYYIVGLGCAAVANSDSTFGVAVSYISGDSAVCVGSTTTFTDHVTFMGMTYSGAWTSSNTAVATVSAGGIVTGISAGTATIVYSATGVPCGTSSASREVFVNSTSSAGTISGASSVEVSLSATLSETVSGGTWSSSNTSVATVSSGGSVTGVATGTSMITYTVSGCGGTVYTTYAITVTALNSISGYVTFSTGYSGPVKVWLITYDPGTRILAALDSTTVYCSGDSVYYQFLNEPTDSFRIKAAVSDSIISGSGYLPTYHTSNFYWYDAAVLAHITGTSNTYQDINMAYGTVTSGPGFIGGNVTTGANRGTSGSIAAVGLQMVAETSAGAIEQQTATDASGNYSFSNLPVGTYTIHPEALNYVSTDYTSVTLTTAAPRVTAANFIQHTVSHTITPGTTGVATVNATFSSVITYPNPTNGNLNIKWQETATETGAVTISDITGREIYKTTINMTEGTGVNQIDLSALTNGLYIISVKSGDINYNSKIQVQK